MRLINLTPHAIVLITPEGDISIPSSGVARTTATPGALGAVAGVPVPVAGPTVYGAVVGLPDPEPGVGYIVSLIVGSSLAASGVRRADIFCPGTGPADNARRDERGQISGVTRLIQPCP